MTKECPICFEIVKNEITTDCNHVFCFLCLTNHLTISPTCPICRRSCNYNEKIDNIREIEIENQEKTIVHTLYSKFINPRMPSTMTIIIVFIIELAIVYYASYNISQKIKNK